MTEKFHEEEVDEDLTSYLSQPVQHKKRTFQKAFEEEEDEEEDQDATKPCSKETKEAIYTLWTQAWDEKGEELLPLVQKLSNMSEQEAKAYLACLKAVHSRSVHKHISSKLLGGISRFICHPSDAVTPLIMEEDKYLIQNMSLMVSDVLTKIGRIGFFMLIFAYGGTSRYFHAERRKPPAPPISAANTAISTDGLRQGGDGENNAHAENNE